ncbi:DNA (cytosine-5-)-methyltransferase [Bosea sp. ASV33]|uniref:DNA cytosine methyltransferase n=1 Tax=Bosea sp. ASV33 TaxID=2795106 RepID=UPI0018EAC762|nr:DNA (cytosine-5-)-methyltransferase [Bosea sp. ASV33]
MSLRVLSLFAGIGGIDAGLEQTSGFNTVAFCEIDPFCREKLAKHWPGVPQYDDVRKLNATRLAADGIAVDAICGGFPCQDLSKAGGRAGLAGKRSGLWFEFARLIDELRPVCVLIENVTRLRAHGLETVLRGLAEIGYDAEWHCVPAAHAGAPDIRDRLWVIAYPQHSYPNSFGSYSAAVDLAGNPELRDQQDRIPGPVLSSLPRRGERLGSGTYGQWRPEPRIRRVVERSPVVVDRLKALGNTVKPIIPEVIGRAILKSLSAKEAA